MFSGFDTFAEGFKRFSLDSLQQDEERQEDGKDNASREERLPVVPEQPTELADSNPTVTKPPSPSKEEASEWDWDEGSAAAAAVKRKGPSKASGSLQPHPSNLQGPQGEATSLSASGMSATAALPAKLGRSSSGNISPHSGEYSEKPQGEDADTATAVECEELRKEEHTFQGGRAPSGVEGLAASPSPPTDIDAFPGKMVRGRFEQTNTPPSWRSPIIVYYLYKSFVQFPMANPAGQTIV